MANIEMAHFFDHIFRLGKLTIVFNDALVLEAGQANAWAPELSKHCTRSAAKSQDMVPVFTGTELGTSE